MHYEQPIDQSQKIHQPKIMMNIFNKVLTFLCFIPLVIACDNNEIETQIIDPIVDPILETESDLAFQKIYDNSGGKGNISLISFEDLLATKVVNVSEGKWIYYSKAIELKTDFSNPTSLTELQTLVDLVNENNRVLVWSDEFDVAGVPNSENWTYDLGATGWGNNEVQNYTKENATVADGILKITAKKLTLPVKTGSNLANFETASEYLFTNLTVEDKNDKNGSPTKVGKIVNVGDGIWEAIVIQQSNYISLLNPSKRVITFDFYQETATERSLILKLEGANKGTQTKAAGKIEVQTTTTATAGWQTVSFDFGKSATVPGDTSGEKILLEYAGMAIFVDPGIATSGTYFIDNISGAEFGGEISSTNSSYTSARMKTEDRYSFTYGKVEVRAKLPDGGGTWPAIWMLGDNIRTIGWPACGEIDIMEHRGNYLGEPSSAIHNLSGYGNTPYVSHPPKDLSVTTRFHTYAINWTKDKIEFIKDDIIHYTYQPRFKDAKNWPFDKNQFIILNVAMGGTLGGNIDPNFTISTMEIDYVRVYQ